MLHQKRQSPRRSPRSVVALRIGADAGRLLDVSDLGLRFELDCPPRRDLPPTIAVVVAEHDVAVRVTVMWTRQQAPGVRICGGVVAADGIAQWQRFVATV